MNAELEHTGTCSCELCQPNWRLGDDGEFQPAPVERQAETENLFMRHLRKLQEAGLTCAGAEG